MLCQRIGEIEYAAFCAAGTKPEVLPWLTYENSPANIPHARWIASKMREGESASLLVNDGEAILQAVCSGLGKSVLPAFLQSRFNVLQALPDYGTVLSREVWLIVHPRIRHLARIQAVMTWIGSALSVTSRTKRLAAGGSAASCF
jgi:DNA-binding transcriptional LysR family regulator